MQTPSGKPDLPKGLNKYSSHVTQPKSQGASQAMLYATGLTEDDMDKPQVRLLSRLLLTFTRPHMPPRAVHFAVWHTRPAGDAL